jgi:hypothetical protein
MGVNSNFDTAVQRLRLWTLKPTGVPGSAGHGAAPSSSTTTMASLAASLSGVASAQPTDAVISSNNIQLSSTQRKRLKAYLKRCRLHPRHTQLNLEGYLLLPVQRVPRYRLMVKFHPIGCDSLTDSGSFSSLRNSFVAPFHPPMGARTSLRKR